MAGCKAAGNKYHCAHWCSLHQRIVKHLPHVCTVATANLTKVVDQWRVKEAELAAHSVEVTLHVLEAVLPELANNEPPFTVGLVHNGDEFAQKVLAKVLDGIEAKTLEGDLRRQPLAPVEHVLGYFAVIVVDI